MKKFKHCSLFSGMGGFDLAAEWMGWENVFHCEWNLFCQQILKYYWPNAITYGDITKTDFTIWRGKIDVLTGGFPCQPYSQAGKRLGKDDDRHLWPEMRRAIREIQPPWVVGENVSGIVNWNGGLVFNEVQADLEAEGYEVQAYILPACSKNAPHKRERVWFIAYSDSFRRGMLRNKEEKTGPQEGNELFRGECRVQDEKRNATNSTNRGLQSWNEKIPINWENQRVRSAKVYRPQDWINFPTQSPLCNGNDGISSKLDSITFSKWRNESIKAGGNAVVPAIPYEIFKAIKAYTELEKIH